MATKTIDQLTSFSGIPTGAELLVIDTGLATNSITLEAAVQAITPTNQVGLANRQELTVTTLNINTDVIEEFDIEGSSAYALLKITTSDAAWVRVYTDAASRSSDGTRGEGTDPSADFGVIAEILSIAGESTVKITPSTIGWNDDSSVSNKIYLSVKNKTAGYAVITTTLTILDLEADVIV